MIPAPDQTIQLSHGGGGGATADLIRRVFAGRFTSTVLHRAEDAAVVDLPGRLAYTTDSFVITPFFFREEILAGWRSLARSMTC